MRKLCIVCHEPFKATSRGQSRCPAHVIKRNGPRRGGSGGAWATIRRQVLARDRHRCVECGECEQLQVHHLIPFAEGGTDSVTNLVTLCRDCHDERHHQRRRNP